MRNKNIPNKRPAHRGWLSVIGRKGIVASVLAVWLLGGVVWPLVHQLDHDHSHQHQTSRRLLHTSQGPMWVTLSPTVHTHSHGVFSRLWHWALHLATGHHHHHHQEHQQADTTPHDPTHGAGDLAHFDLLDKTNPFQVAAVPSHTPTATALPQPHAMPTRIHPRRYRSRAPPA